VACACLPVCFIHAQPQITDRAAALEKLQALEPSKLSVLCYSDVPRSPAERAPVGLTFF
jgi:hypothetical protein